MTLKTLWRRHVEWRFARNKARAIVVATVQCTRCKRMVEDEAFKYCATCRTKAARSAVALARRRKRAGRCPKCGHPNDADTVVCDPCLALQRDQYEARRQ